MKDGYTLIFSILFTVFSTLSTNAEVADTIMVPSPYVNYGKIIRFSSFPSTLVSPRTIDVWLPDNYTPKQQYAVIYIQDGQLLFDATQNKQHQEWGLDEVLQTLQDSLRPVIIVGVWSNDTLRNAEYYPEKSLAFLTDNLKKEIIINELHGKSLSDDYTEFIVTELKPFIESAFSASRKPEDNFIMGSDIGALISMYMLCEYPQNFGGAICMDTRWILSKKEYPNEVTQSLLAYLEENLPIAGAGKKLYFDIKSDGMERLEQYQQEIVNGIFYRKGFSSDNFLTLQFEIEEYDEDAWRNSLEFPLLFMLRKKISN